MVAQRDLRHRVTLEAVVPASVADVVAEGGHEPCEFGQIGKLGFEASFGDEVVEAVED